MSTPYLQELQKDKVFTRVFDPSTGEAWIFVGSDYLERLGLSGRFDGCPKIEKHSVCIPESREFREFSDAFLPEFGTTPNVATIYGGTEYVSKIRKAEKAALLN